MDNMSNHEIYICGWITGRLESAGLHCSIAHPDIFPFGTMGYMLSKAHGAHKITRELHKEIGNCNKSLVFRRLPPFPRRDIPRAQSKSLNNRARRKAALVTKPLEFVIKHKNAPPVLCKPLFCNSLLDICNALHYNKPC